MTDLRARVAYLQGLAEGMALDDSTREGRLLGEMIDVLEAIAGTVDDLGEQNRQLEEYICEMDQDLSEVEEEVLLGGAGAAAGDDFDDGFAVGDDDGGEDVDDEDPAYAVEGEAEDKPPGLFRGDHGATEPYDRR